MVFVTVGAAGQAPSAAPAATADRPVASTPGPSDVTADRVLSDVSRLRELRILRAVPSGLKSRDDIRAMVLHDMAEHTTPAKMRTTSRMLEFLGLVDAGFSLEREAVSLLTEQIAGFYDPRTRFFYLADWIPIDEQRAIMAHELTHALTDQHYDLKRFEDWPDGDSDAELAARALVEGDATALMIEYSLDQRGAPYDLSRIPVSLTEILRAGASTADAEHPAYAGAPEVLKQNLQFPYVYGAGFVQALLRSGSWTRVDDAYRSLPVSTEQVIHPDKYLSGDRPAPVAITDVSRRLGPGWHRVDSDVNGEFGYYLILRDVLDEKVSSKAAAGWGGDRYGFYSDAKGENFTLLQASVWDSTGDAQEFFEAYARRIELRYGLTPATQYNVSAIDWKTDIGTVRIERSGSRVVIVEGYRGDDVRSLTAAFLP